MQIRSTIPLHCWEVETKDDRKLVRFPDGRWFEKIVGGLTTLTQEEHKALEAEWFDDRWGLDEPEMKDLF